MSLGDAYTLGVRLTGDISSLRQELQQGTQVIAGFANASQEAMNRAAAAMDRAATAMQSSGERTRRATEAPQRSLPRTASSFEDYMRRATRAQEDVARTSEQTAQRTGQSLDGVGSSLARLTGYAGFGLLARQVWQTGAGFHEFTQNTQVALTTLLGSRDAAQGFLADILDFAKQTPYAFTALTDQAQKLLTYGFQTEEIIPILRATGDAATAMGKGTEGVERLNRALGQIQAKGRLQSEELLQMNEIGVNGLKILANQAGMTTIEYQELVTAGLVPAEQAVAGLVKGINEGTDGINGQTAAFGGLMAEIKGSGGITATLDSARTGFRNAAAAVTDSLIPAYTGFLRLSTQGLGVVRDTANVFNALPQPVQSSALAFAATAVAVRLLNVQGRASGVWQAYQAQLATARVQADLLTVSTSRMRVGLGMIRATAGAAGAALLGAFGGPVGLAIAGTAAAMSAFAASSADAKARADAFSGALEQVGDEADAAVEKILRQNFITGDNMDWGWFQKWQAGYESAADAVEGLGLSLDDVTEAIAGPQEGFDAFIAQLREMKETADSSQWEAIDEVIIKSQQQRNALERERHEQEQLNGAQAASVDGLGRQAAAYQRSTAAIQAWGEEQVKALDAAAEAAAKAFSPNVGALNLNLASEGDVAKAREEVEEATRRLRDAEDERADQATRDTVTASERRRAEESVADARKALQEATEGLAETEARTDPVAQYRKQVEQILEDSRTFVQDIQALADQGLNAIDLQQIIQAGPEGSADVRKALLGDPGMIDFTNEARETIEALTTEVERQARITQTGIDQAGKVLGSNLGLAMRIAAAEGSGQTIEEIATALGEDPEKIFNIGRTFGMTFLAGLADALEHNKPVVQFGDGSFQTGPGAPKGYATGGIYPGYTPGRDIGYIGVSGGEAIMRPEFTRAVGADFVHRMNALARSGGVGAVQRAMGRFLGGFNTGGIIGGAPQVVTVPVQSTVERHAPFYADKVYIGSLSDAEHEQMRRRANSNLTGRRM